MPKVPKWVTRFHRTRTDYTPAIDKEGLKAKSPNIGENTYVDNAKDLENVWLADNRYNIPVLRRYGASPDVTTYKVRIPHNKYWYEMKRNTMPKGRGGGEFKLVKPGQSSMFSEGDYKVDLIGEDIPPQYLQKLPIYNKDPKMLTEDILTELIDYDASGSPEESIAAALRGLPRRLRGEGQHLADTYYLAGPELKLLPSEELVRALTPSATNAKVVDFVKKHRANLAKIKSPAHALAMTLDEVPEVPTVYNVPLSWNIYDPATTIYPAKDVPVHQGSISRGLNQDQLAEARAEHDTRRAAADIIRNKKLKANEYLSRNLGRQPTAEELDQWARAGILYDIDAGNIMDVPVALGAWAAKVDLAIDRRLSNEILKHMNIK